MTSITLNPMDAQSLSNDEFARRGNALFRKYVRPHVDLKADAHKFAAIDVETGTYATHADERKATRRLLRQRPEARGSIWYRRVGSENAYRIT